MLFIRLRVCLRHLIFLSIVSFLYFLSNFAYASRVGYCDYGVIANQDGTVGVHGIWYEGGKQKVCPKPNFSKTLQWQLEQDKFKGASEIKAPVVSARTGAQSVGTVTATVIDERGKRQVMAEIHAKARQGGKMLGKGAVNIARGLGSANPYVRAFLIAEAALTGSQFFWSDEKGDFVQESDDETRIVFTTSNGSGISIGSTDEKGLKTKCPDCTVIGIVKGSVVANEMATSYCKSQTYKTSGNKTRNYNAVGWSGYCYDTEGNRISNDKAVKIAKYIDYVPMTLDEFDKEATPEAQEDPDVWVNTATDTQSQSKPRVTVLDGDAYSNPYTDPTDGKTKQTGWRFRGGLVDEYDVPRPDLTPDSPQAPRTEPPTNTGSGTGTGTGDDTGTGDGDKDGDKDDDDPKNGTGSGTGIGSGNKNPTETEDLCEKHPEILACQQMGTVEDGFFDDISIPQITDDKTWSEDNFLPSNGVCPAPKSFNLFGKPIYISYEPLCRFLQQVRFIILVAFILMSAYLVFGSLRKE